VVPEGPANYVVFDAKDIRMDSQRNPLLGNTGLEFKQAAARRMLCSAIHQEGYNVEAADDLIAKAFSFAKKRWEAHYNRILPHREWAALRVESTLRLAQVVASGELSEMP
jgi:hypothetical protein